MHGGRLRGGRACGTYGAICTGDHKVLSNTETATIPGPPALTVADARVQEAVGATLDFTVTLSRAASGTVTVDYETSNGSATAGTDYTATQGTLTFAAGETDAVVSVPVLDDAHDEGEETLTLTLSNAQGAWIEDGEATGTIQNSDLMPQAWLARFGRTAADHVLDAVGARLEGNPAGSTRLTLGGREVLLDASFRDDELWEQVPASRLAGGFARGPGDGRAGRREKNGDSLSREVSMGEMLLGSSFHMASAGGGGKNVSGRWSLWGRGARSGFNGQEGELTLDGDVSTGVVGADYESGRTLMGVALAFSAGDGSYTASGARGEVESTLASAHPYLRYAVSERLAFWGVVGLGQGELTLEPEGQERMETDLSMGMAAFGLRGALFSVAGFDLALKSDVVYVQTESDETTGLAAADANTRRLRLALEGSSEVKAGDATLRPSLEVGLRHDGGDAETGSGVEIGGGLRWANSRGLTMEVRARGLIAHEEKDYEEWGVSASVSLTPGEGGRGLSLRAGSSWGAASGGAERLWSQRAAAGLASGGEFEPGAASFDAEAGYGLDYMGGLLTPYTGMSVSESGRTWRAGGRFKLGERLTMSLEGDLREKDNGENPAHGIALKGALRW